LPRLSVKAAVAGACLAVIGLTASLGIAQVAAPAPPPAAEAPPAPPPGVRLAPGQPIPPAELEAYVDGLVAGGMASDHIAGVTVSVVQNGQVVLKKGYGVASLSPARPVDPDTTLFRLASISKTFTWITVMKEVEAGHMRLDGPVNLYLPENLQVKDQGFKQPVRIRDLMTHTSGFEDRALGQLFERDAARERPLALYLRQERPRRVREPGQTPAYSNYGVALAGKAVVNVTGKPFENLVEDEIIRPLGLGHTTFREPHPPRADLPAPLTGPLAGDFSDGFRWANGGFERRPPEFMGHIAPAVALSSTAGDMARYMLLLLGGGALDGVTIYNPGTAHAFATPLSRPLPGATGWNAGFQEVRLPGGVMGFGHNGVSVSFRSNLVVAPSLNLGVFIAANTETGGKLAKRLPEEIVERFYLPTAATPPAPSPDLYGQRGLYEGSYLTTRRAFGRLEGFVDMFVAGTRVKVTPAGYLTTASDEGVRRWTPVGAANSGVFRSVDSPDRLVFDVSGGRASRFIAPWGGEAFERAGPLTGIGMMETVAILAIVAAVLTLVGLGLRDRREFRETQMQRRASLMQTTQAVLFLASIGLFAIWSTGTGDRASVIYNWPGGWMLTASALALVSYVLAIVTLVLLPFIWRGGRRVDSWTGGRKLRFTATALIFFVFGSLLGVWGAILPWIA
jgi:CubicO group peptidase (beta-lactamase class C family)